jgi:hypothetical protein
MILKKIILFFAVLLLLFSCARVVAPSGGPVDKKPPLVKKTVPQNNSIHFNADKIEIYFDEFIAIRNFNQEFFISPPLEEKPEKILRGKKLILKFNKNLLHSNTTYTLSFGKSIADYRAGNILKDFQYVFSTGESIDSLQIGGRVLSAKELKAEEGFVALLYKNKEINSIKTQKPDYAALVDASGYFSINHIAEGDYKILALKDINHNFLFDLPEEEIAFLDSTIHIEIKDTILKQKIQLFTFKEDANTLYVSDYKRKDKYTLQWNFNHLYEKDFNFEIQNTKQNSYQIERAVNDTFKVYLIDSNLYNRTKIVAYLSYQGEDSLHKTITITDTLKFTKYKFPQKDTLLPLFVNIKNKNSIDFFKKINIKTPYPISRYNRDSIKLFIQDLQKKYHLQDLVFKKDSLLNTLFYLNDTLQTKANYRLQILPKTFQDYLGRYNDTLQIDFQVKDENIYSTIKINLKGLRKNTPYILQLIDGKSEVLRKQYLQKDTICSFSYLMPQTYQLKLIEDENADNKWTTGDLKLKRQAEKVFYYKEKISTKAHWTNDIIWTIKK